MSQKVSDTHKLTSILVPNLRMWLILVG